MYHGIIIDQQFEDPKFPEQFDVFAIKQDGDWKIYGIQVEDNKLDEVISKVQQAMKPGKWYAHFYNDEILVVVFKEVVFDVLPEKYSWDEVIEYGKELGIPEDQLDFQPNSFSDEAQYFGS
jgi:hypothetical protein